MPRVIHPSDLACVVRRLSKFSSLIATLMAVFTYYSYTLCAVHPPSLLSRQVDKWCMGSDRWSVKSLLVNLPLRCCYCCCYCCLCFVTFLCDNHANNATQRHIGHMSVVCQSFVNQYSDAIHSFTCRPPSIAHWMAMARCEPKWLTPKRFTIFD